LGKGTYARVYRAYEIEIDSDDQQRPTGAHVVGIVIIKVSVLVRASDDTYDSANTCGYFKTSFDMHDSPFTGRLAIFIEEVLAIAHLMACRRVALPPIANVLTQTTGTIESYGFTVYDQVGGPNPVGYVVYADDTCVRLFDFVIRAERDANAAARLRRRCPFIMYRLALALTTVHRCGIAHTDLSLGNVLVACSRNDVDDVVVNDNAERINMVKIIDFGWASITTDSAYSAIERMSDEYVRNAFVNLCETARAEHADDTNSHIFKYLSHALRLYDTGAIMEPTGVCLHPVIDPPFTHNDVAHAFTPGQFAQRVDVYALAIIWLELINGKYASSRARVDTMRQHAHFQRNRQRRLMLTRMLDSRDPVPMIDVVRYMCQYARTLRQHG